MNQPKFKVWDTVSKKMSPSFHLFGEMTLLGGIHAWQESYREIPRDGCLQALNDLVILQYTGLKDKNGVEIYEGDIVKANCYPFYSDAPEMKDGKENPEELNYLGVVDIDPDGVYYDLQVVSNRVSGRASGGNLSEIINGTEKLGNRYENPELLEVVV